MRKHTPKPEAVNHVHFAVLCNTLSEWQIAWVPNPEADAIMDEVLQILAPDVQALTGAEDHNDPWEELMWDVQVRRSLNVIGVNDRLLTLQASYPEPAAIVLGMILSLLKRHDEVLIDIGEYWPSMTEGDRNHVDDMRQRAARLQAS